MNKKESATNQVALTQVFNLNENSVRVQVINDEPWFVASDVCKCIGIKNNRDINSRLDEDERRVSVIPTPSGEQQMIIVNESGLYNLIFQSRKPEAKAFRKWVTSEVLPSIRKTGSFKIPDENIKIKGETNARIYLEPGDIKLASIKFNVDENYIRNIFDGAIYDIKIMRYLMNIALSNREILYKNHNYCFNGMGI